MLFKGDLAETQVVDILQFIDAGGRSGCLTLRRGGKRASVVFKEGDIVMATVEGDERNLGTALVERGVVRPEDITRAVEAQRGPLAGVPLGQILIRMGLITNAELKSILEERIRNVIYDIILWTDGSYVFNDHELTQFGDIVVPMDEIMPDVHLDTQMLIVESVKIFDERSKLDTRDYESRTTGTPSEAPEETSREPFAAFVERPVTEPGIIYLVTADDALVAIVGEVARRTNRGLFIFENFDAMFDELVGAAGAGELPAVVLDEKALLGRMVDVTDYVVDAISKLTRLFPGIGMIVIGGPKDDEGRVELLELGARAYVNVPDGAGKPLLVSKTKDIIERELHVYLNNVFAFYEALKLNKTWSKRASSLESYFLKVRQFIKDSSQTNISFIASLDLLNLIAENYDRAMLFLARPDSLVGIGGFGAGVTAPLGIVAKRISIPLAEESIFQRVYRSKTTFIGKPDKNNVWHKFFFTMVKRPATGESMVIPLLSENKVVAVVYCDNGDKKKKIEYDELLDLLSNQTRILYENILMERLPQPGEN